MDIVLLGSILIQRSFEGLSGCRSERKGEAMTSSLELRPEDFLHFVETDEFREDFESLGLDVEADLFALQLLIMSAPEAHPIIKGTGGLRKARFASADSGRGKRGAIRVCYAFFKRHWLVLLVMAYGKDEKGNLSPSERAGVKVYLEAIESYLNERSH
jgi:hypothetical protein